MIPVIPLMNPAATVQLSCDKSILPMSTFPRESSLPRISAMLSVLLIILIFSPLLPLICFHKKTPILLPIVTSLGVHPVHFAAILGVNLGMGNLTPPTAPMLYLSGRICNAKINTMLKPIMVLLIFAYLPVLLLTTFVPALSLTLPKLILPKVFGL